MKSKRRTDTIREVDDTSVIRFEIPRVDRFMMGNAVAQTADLEVMDGLEEGGGDFDIPVVKLDGPLPITATGGNVWSHAGSGQQLPQRPLVLSHHIPFEVGFVGF